MRDLKGLRYEGTGTPLSFSPESEWVQYGGLTKLVALVRLQGCEVPQLLVLINHGWLPIPFDFRTDKFRLAFAFYHLRAGATFHFCLEFFRDFLTYSPSVRSLVTDRHPINWASPGEPILCCDGGTDIGDTDRAKQNEAMYNQAFSQSKLDMLYAITDGTTQLPNGDFKERCPVRLLARMPIVFDKSCAAALACEWQALLRWKQGLSADECDWEKAWKQFNAENPHGQSRILNRSMKTAYAE